MKMHTVDVELWRTMRDEDGVVVDEKRIGDRRQMILALDEDIDREARRRFHEEIAEFPCKDIEVRSRPFS